MNFFMLIPGIFELCEKILGPVLSTASAASSVVKAVATNPTVSGIMSGIEKAVGSVTDAQRLQIQGELQTLLAQAQLDSQESAKSSFFYSGPRPTLFWGLVASLLMSVLVEPSINYILGFFGISGPAPFVLSPIVITLLSSLCGIFMVGRTVEKINGVHNSH